MHGRSNRDGTNTWNLTWHYMTNAEYFTCWLMALVIFSAEKMNTWACFIICKDLVTNADHT